MRISLGTTSLVFLLILLSAALSNSTEQSTIFVLRAAQTSGFAFAAGWTAAAPTINGTFVPKEWQSSVAIAFNITYNTGPRTKPGLLYVMNDADNLYLAVKVNDTDFNRGDVLEFFFDNNNTGVMTKGDDVLQYDVNALMTSQVRFFDEFLNSFGSGHMGQAEDRAFGGRTDGMGAGSGDGQYNYFEMSHPLNSGDKGHDISLKPGDTFGLLLRYDDDGRIGSFWPGESPGIPDYAVRAQITLAMPPDFSISTSPANVTVQAGNAASSSIILTSLNGFSGTVFLSADSTNLFASLDSRTVTLSNGGTGTSKVIIRPGSAVLPGTYQIRIMAVSGSTSHNATVQTLVTAASDPRILGLSLPIFYSATGLVGVILALAASLSFLRRKRLHFHS